VFSIDKDAVLTVTTIAGLCVGGILGSIVVYFGFFSRLQTDLSALLRLVRK
jgi:hypothetical protein